MTKQEKVIVSAYTGTLMCDFGDVHEYIERKLSRPVYTHELADKNIQKEIEEKSKEDFLEICKQEEPERKTGRWIKDEEQSREHTEPIFICSCCQNNSAWGTEERTRYCSFCGARMENES